MAKEDGGAAFPSAQEDDVFIEEFGRYEKRLTRPVGGMSLRDYFAAKALAGMHARDSYDEGLATPTQRARIAYLDADAMLAERAK